MPNIPRPFNPVEAEAICERIATSSDGLIKLCKEFKLGTETFYKWLENDENMIGNESFQKRYARAKDIQMDLLAEQTLAIADDGTNDTMTITMPNGQKKKVEDREWTSRSKQRIEARQWLISKLNPKKYGNKVEVNQTLKSIPILSIDPLNDSTDNSVKEDK